MQKAADWPPFAVYIEISKTRSYPLSNTSFQTTMYHFIEYIFP